MFPPGTALAWSSRSGTCTPCSRARVRAEPALWMSPLEKCFYIYTLYFLCRARSRSKPAGADKKRQKTYFLRGILQRRHLANTSYTLCELSAAARRLSENVPEEVFFCHFFRRCRIHYESKRMRRHLFVLVNGSSVPQLRTYGCRSYPVRFCRGCFRHARSDPSFRIRGRQGM